MSSAGTGSSSRSPPAATRSSTGTADAGAARRDGAEEARLRSRRLPAIRRRSWTTTTPRATGGKYRMIPIFTSAVSLAVKTKGPPDDGRQRRGRLRVSARHAGDRVRAARQRTGMTTTQALQAGTIVNARVIGWDGQIGSITKGKFADLVAVPGDPVGRHHAASQGELRDEGRKGYSTRLTLMNPTHRGTEALRDHFDVLQARCSRVIIRTAERMDRTRRPLEAASLSSSCGMVSRFAAVLLRMQPVRSPIPMPSQSARAACPALPSDIDADVCRCGDGLHSSITLPSSETSISPMCHRLFTSALCS